MNPKNKKRPISC